MSIVLSVAQHSKEGDLHDQKFNAYGLSTYLTRESQTMHPRYFLSIYPTDIYVDQYSTNNPQIATIAAISVIILISILFILYDYFVRQEFHERRELLEAKRRFIRYVSHEVRTPINACLMGLNIVHHEEKDPEMKNLLQEIQNSANSAVLVLNEVLQYDKIEQRTLTIEIALVDIWALVQKSFDEFKLSAQSKRLNFKLSYDISTFNGDIECGSELHDLPSNIRNLVVVGDAPKILQIIRNLLSNAVKFTSEQGFIQLSVSYNKENIVNNKAKSNLKSKCRSNITEKITLKTGDEIRATPNGYFSLSVIDSGVGMNQSQLGRLFGEGVQFNANDLQAGKGSGLGLFIARNLATHHGGSLTAFSEGIGKGSVFTLKLPLSQCNITLVPEEVQKLQESESSSNYQKKHLNILVVDDVATNRKLLCRLLERNGHQCCMAENGEIALNMVRKNMSTSDENRLFDCILIDYEMPVLNGPNATQKIREMGNDTFIVGITGNTLSDDVEYFQSMGANVVLPKPVNLDVLEDLFVEYGI
eukprot:scaffold24778_cov67-Cyclotella_meneghiniana.AAC.3